MCRITNKLINAKQLFELLEENNFYSEKLNRKRILRTSLVLTLSSLSGIKGCLIGLLSFFFWVY